MARHDASGLTRDARVIREAGEKRGGKGGGDKADGVDEVRRCRSHHKNKLYTLHIDRYTTYTKSNRLTTKMPDV